MNSQKFALGSLAGGIVYFFLGYLFFGLLLKDFFADNGGATGNMDTMVWWALILGNLVSGILLTYILGKANITTAGGGAGTGFVVGLLIALSHYLIVHGVTNSPTLKAVGADAAVFAVMSSIAGAVIGWVLGSGKKA